MKRLFNSLLWIISIILILVSIGGFMAGDIAMAIIVLAIGLFILPPVTKKLFRKKKKVPSNEKLEQIHEEIRIYAEIKNEFYPPAIQQQGVQILETLNILSTTKNIDTLKGRFEFISQFYDDHIKASHNKRFLSDIQKSIDQYKSTYYERIPIDYEMNLLIKPSKENLNKFYIECIKNCFTRFFEDQKKQIETLKKQDAKNRRLEKIRKVHADAIIEIKDKSKDLDEQVIEQYISEIDNSFQNYFTSLTK